MSKALRCDVCQEIYPFYNRMRGTSKIFVSKEPFYLTIKVTAQRHPYAEPEYSDICETCIKDMMLDWMKGESNE